MAMSIDQMNAMMANMNRQNYMNNLQLAHHFQEISNTFASMAQSDYQMYQMNAGQAQGKMSSMPEQMSGAAGQAMPGMGSMAGMGTMTGGGY